MSDNGPHLLAGEDLHTPCLVYERDGKVYAFPGQREAPPEQPLRLPLWERIVCFVLDTLTRAVDGFTRWLQRW